MANEKRLIDANEIEELFYKQVEWGATDLMDAFDDALQDAQTVDAVEVVRCKDCKHFLPNTDVNVNRGVCEHYGVTCWLEKYEDDFCSYGERKDDG